jgi:hypothetical protein
MTDFDGYINIQPNVHDKEERESLNKTSIAKVLLFFYVFMTSGSAHNLVGSPLRRFIDDNRMVQHFIAFLLLFSLVITFDSEIFGSNYSLSVTDALIYTVICYTWFIFSTKLDAQWNIILIMILIGIFVMDTHFKTQEESAKSDPNLTNEQKVNIIKSNNMIRTYVTSFAILVTILGTVLYSDRKAEQYGGSYDIFTYILN